MGETKDAATQIEELRKGLAKAKRVDKSLKTNYLKMSEGEKGRFIALDFSTMEVEDDNGNRESIPCVELENEKGEFFTAAQRNLMEQVGKLALPCAIELECMGVKKSKNGNEYTEFTVFELAL